RECRLVGPDGVLDVFVGVLVADELRPGEEDAPLDHFLLKEALHGEPLLPFVVGEDADRPGGEPGAVEVTRQAELPDHLAESRLEYGPLTPEVLDHGLAPHELNARFGCSQ